MSKHIEDINIFLNNQTWPLSQNFAEAMINKIGGEVQFVKDYQDILVKRDSASNKYFLLDDNFIGSLTSDEILVFFDKYKGEFMAFAKQAGTPYGMGPTEFICMTLSSHTPRGHTGLTMDEVEKAWFEVSEDSPRAYSNKRWTLAHDMFYCALSNLSHAYAEHVKKQYAKRVKRTV